MLPQAYGRKRIDGRKSVPMKKICTQVAKWKKIRKEEEWIIMVNLISRNP